MIVSNLCILEQILTSPIFQDQRTSLRFFCSCFDMKWKPFLSMLLFDGEWNLLFFNLAVLWPNKVSLEMQRVSTWLRWGQTSTTTRRVNQGFGRVLMLPLQCWKITHAFWRIFNSLSRSYSLRRRWDINRSDCMIVLFWDTSFVSSHCQLRFSRNKKHWLLEWMIQHSPKKYLNRTIY